MTLSEIVTVREWLFDNSLEFTETEFDDLMVRLETNSIPPQKESPTLKLHKPSLDVLDLEAEFLNSDNSEPEQIIDARTEEKALEIGKIFCRENSLDVSDRVLVECIRRLRDEL